MTYGKSSAVTVTVSADRGRTPTGTVQIKNGATVLGTGTVTGGTADDHPAGPVADAGDGRADRGLLR